MAIGVKVKINYEFYFLIKFKYNLFLSSRYLKCIKVKIRSINDEAAGMQKDIVILPWYILFIIICLKSILLFSAFGFP